MGSRLNLAYYSGKTAFIVGGTSGIGLATARLLVKAGANVAVFSRSPDRLAAARKELEAARPQPDRPRILAQALDVTLAPAVSEVMNQIVQELGPPDILMNFAGRARPRHFLDIPPTQVEEIIRLNFLGTWHTTAALVPVMPRGGHVVNVSSVAGLLGVFGYTDYCASKFAVIGFSEALRAELAPRGLKVTVLCPPDTDTPGLAEENLTKPNETKAISGNVKLLTADRVAQALLAVLPGGRFMVIPGWDGRMTWWAKRLVPWLVNWIMDRVVKKLQTGR